MAPGTDCDVLIIGGGIAGLTAAAMARRGGARTRLLEGALSFGGRARTQEKDGFKYNLGPHALYRRGAGMRMLAALGIEPAGATPDLRLTFMVHRGARGAGDLAVLPALPGRAQPALDEALATVARGFMGAADEPIEAALRRLTPNMSAQAALQALVRVSSYCHAPHIGSAEALLDQLRLALGGVRYLHDGWGAMIAQLVSVARGAGATLETEVRAARAEPTTTGWRVITLAGEAIESATLVIAVPPTDAAALAPTVAPLKAAAEAAVPVRVSTLDVGLARLPDPARTFALGLDAPTYLSVHSVAARLAPEGGAMIHVMRYLGDRESPTPETRAELESVLSLLQPGWREVRVGGQWLPAATVAHDLPLALTSGLSGRCPVAIAPGLFVAGDWVGAEGLLADAAFASGSLAGESAAELRTHGRAA